MTWQRREIRAIKCSKLHVTWQDSHNAELRPIVQAAKGGGAWDNEVQGGGRRMSKEHTEANPGFHSATE